MRDMVRIRGGAPQRYRGPDVKIGRSQIDRSHNHKTTFDVGELIPYFVDEVLPGDTFTCQLNAFIRIFSPLKSPIMDNIEVGIDFFFIPNRLVWDNWEDFIGPEHDAAGAQDTTYTVPIMSGAGAIDDGNDGERLARYMGIPWSLVPNNEDLSALLFRSYDLLYTEWYRDQNVIDSPTLNTGAGPDALGSQSLYKSAKKHDYFTSSLPYIQKGTASTVALSGTPDVYTAAQTTESVSVYATDTSNYKLLDSGAATVDISSSTDADGSEKLYVDLSTAGTVDINALRYAAAIQRMLERDARGGTRYQESIRAHFGVDAGDHRLQRPEYLGGGRGFVHVSPIGNTSAVDSTVSVSGADEFQGELAGIGTGTLSGGFAKSFVEHGHVIGILRARGEVSYQQGLDRMWSRSSRYDFYWPELSMLGEQSVLNKELFINNDSTDDDIFGYQERYAEYRYKKSLVTGLFSSDATGSIDFWHLSEDFASQPSLNQTFLEDQTPMDRVRATTTGPDFEIDGRFNYKCARPMPVRPVPTLMPPRF